MEENKCIRVIIGRLSVDLILFAELGIHQLREVIIINKSYQV